MLPSTVTECRVGAPRNSSFWLSTLTTCKSLPTLRTPTVESTLQDSLDPEFQVIVPRLFPFLRAWINWSLYVNYSSTTPGDCNSFPMITGECQTKEVMNRAMLFLSTYSHRRWFTGQARKPPVLPKNVPSCRNSQQRSFKVC